MRPECKTWNSTKEPLQEAQQATQWRKQEDKQNLPGPIEFGRFLEVVWRCHFLRDSEQENCVRQGLFTNVLRPVDVRGYPKTKTQSSGTDAGMRMDRNRRQRKSEINDILFSCLVDRFVGRLIQFNSIQ